MKDKHYMYFKMITNLLALLHAEHVMIIKTILLVSLRKEDAERIGENMERNYNKAFDDIRKDWG